MVKESAFCLPEYLKEPNFELNLDMHYSSITARQRKVETLIR